jgi:hypothetical protein
LGRGTPEVEFFGDRVVGLCDRSEIPIAGVGAGIDEVTCGDGGQSPSQQRDKELEAHRVRPAEPSLLVDLISHKTRPILSLHFAEAPEESWDEQGDAMIELFELQKKLTSNVARPAFVYFSCTFSDYRVLGVWPRN